MGENMGSDASYAARQAASMLYCLDRLIELQVTPSQFSWLWRLRAKVLNYIINKYHVRDIAESYELNDEDRQDVFRCEKLLHPPPSMALLSYSDEVQKLCDELQDKCESLFSASDDSAMLIH